MNLLHFLPAGWGKEKGGGEWCGPCPGCGGEDRFVVWPEHASGATGGKYLCRNCAPEGGDCIQFLRDFQGMTYRDACKALNMPTAQKRSPVPVKAVEWKPEQERIPSQAWQARAKTFLSSCRAGLETAEGRAALDARGLSFDFALAHGLGWNLADQYETPELWGLESWVNSKGNLGKLYLPVGLVIPTFRKSGPVAVKIRRRDWKPGDDWPKYHAIKGGGSGSLVLGKAGLPVVLVESELDALLIAQEVSSLCSTVALGSASNRPHTTSTAFLKAAPRILCALDFDKPDTKGRRAGANASQWWMDNFRQARRWPPTVGKDPGEMHLSGVPVRLWVEAGLSSFAGHTEISSPLPFSEAKSVEGDTTPAATPEKITEINSERFFPSWIRPHIPGEALDDDRERRCKSARCGAVLMRQEENDESWRNKRYCSGECWGGKPFIPLEVTNENSH